MATSGTFKLDRDGSYTGNVTTLAFKARVKIVPNPDKSADNQPDYRVFSQGNVEIGAAWKKTSDQGRTYLSVSLDDPSFAAPLNAAPLNAAPLNAAPLNAAPLNAAPLNAAPLNAAPLNAAPLNAALIAGDGDDGSFVLAWTRPRRNAG